MGLKNWRRIAVAMIETNGKSLETTFHNPHQDSQNPPHHDWKVKPQGFAKNRKLQLVGRGKG